MSQLHFNCRFIIMPHDKEHLGEDAAIKLHKCPNENWFPKWTKLLNRVKYQVNKHTRICFKGTTI